MAGAAPYPVAAGAESQRARAGQYFDQRGQEHDARPHRRRLRFVADDPSLLRRGAMATLFRRSLSFYRDNLFPPLFLPVPAQHEDRTETKLCRIITTENGPGSRQARKGAPGRIRRVPSTAVHARAISGAPYIRPSVGRESSRGKG